MEDPLPASQMMSRVTPACAFLPLVVVMGIQTLSSREGMSEKIRFSLEALVCL